MLALAILKSMHLGIFMYFDFLSQSVRLNFPPPPKFPVFQPFRRINEMLSVTPTISLVGLFDLFAPFPSGEAGGSKALAATSSLGSHSSGAWHENKNDGGASISPNVQRNLYLFIHVLTNILYIFYIFLNF